MKTSSEIKVYVALIHHPVVNKKREIITSAVTGLDLHDISRVSKTYGIKAVYIVTPLADQRTLVKRLLDHWLCGAGARYNPIRTRALELIKVVASHEDAVENIRGIENIRPETVATCAGYAGKGLSYDRFREMTEEGAPYLLTFGTAWGLSEAFIENSDYVLDPISGAAGYNHLSVRSAASIIIDRVLGPNGDNEHS